MWPYTLGAPGLVGGQGAGSEKQFWVRFRRASGAEGLSREWAGQDKTWSWGQSLPRKGEGSRKKTRSAKALGARRE